MQRNRRHRAPAVRLPPYTNAGYIYLWPGCRSKSEGAPAGVTDLKAAIRYYRYLQAEQNAVPGNVNCMFSFGMSGGGAQSALLGASGNSSLYDAYLNAIGADMDYKDDVCGSQCWCPITNLDEADGAYEWNMGLNAVASPRQMQVSTRDWPHLLPYINSIGLKNLILARLLRSHLHPTDIINQVLIIHIYGRHSMMP